MQSRWQASENAVTQMLQFGRSGMGCREGTAPMWWVAARRFRLMQLAAVRKRSKDDRKAPAAA
ncbi:MAG: hypothetical protein U0J42_05745 [[Bacteroides] pectinophilus]|nr:hypothetical protein [[Bacteroides] pectinophilus]